MSDLTAALPTDVVVNNEPPLPLRSSLAIGLVIVGVVATIAWSALLAWIVIRFLIVTLW